MPSVPDLPDAPPLGADVAAALGVALAAKQAAGGYRPRTHHLVGDAPTYTNRLILESSPYLLQHAHNPVDWRAWGDEAFDEARRLGRPVFLSIGYATCHWCHVMEAESFEDEEIAAFMNGHYVCIKVDREERPDVDAVYMAAVQALTQSGGWPMSVWLTPDREPFYGGTYFPPREGARGARLGFLELLGEIHQTYVSDTRRVEKAAEALVKAVRGQLAPSPAESASPIPGTALLDQTVAVYKRIFDPVEGGLRRAPKFPSNVPVRLLLRAHRRTGDAETLAMVTLTLEKMAGGGMYDQIGGGFHRYSTDAQWLVPHFEKMLYDNALLAVAYSEALQVTGRRDFARVVRETLDYLGREMTAPGGGFYSATDADSEGPDGVSAEGKFFVWSKQEIDGIVGADAARFDAHYGVTAGGNFASAELGSAQRSPSREGAGTLPGFPRVDEGENILHVAHPDEEAWAALAGARAALYAVRAKRPPPLRDEKILAAWNGLAISGFAVAGRVLGEPRYVEAAARAAAFVLGEMRPQGRLVRSWKDGRPGVTAFLDDYAFLIAGLLDLFEASFQRRWLEAALALADEMQRRFADPAGGWFMTADDHEQLIAREKPAYDGAEPSGASVALLSVQRLHTFTSDDRWRAVADKALANLAAALTENPLALAEALLAVDHAADQPREIAVVWPDGGAAGGAPLLDVLRRTFVPNRALAAGSEAETAALAGLIPWLADKPALAGRPTAYVCVQGRCDLPVHDPDALAARLSRVAG
ncbi:MAG TPA: thioredoxin domain-containing protein [Polyangia bacterium]|nr:thioredoxin domain-containing protein [Polyangia bacterium]